MEEQLLIARLTSKGQVTVPKAVRKRLGLERGDFLVFAAHQGSRIEIRRLPGRTLSQLHGALRIPRSVPYPHERAAYRRARAKRIARGRSAP